MESALRRKEALTAWVAQNVAPDCAILPLKHDASFRRYFRVEADGRSYLVMDAPPPLESTHSFICISRALRAAAIDAPEIIKADTEQGFLLITDFGDITYLNALNSDNADRLYQLALSTLSMMSEIRAVPDYTLPMFTAEFMQKEWVWHKEWFAEKWLGLSTDKFANLDQCYQQLINEIDQQPKLFMHRDYHSGNLMVMPHGVGVLDFQDAFIGPVTYDLASLLRDCYIDWPASRIQQWVNFYWELLRDKNLIADTSLTTFTRWFDWMSVQRHLKALMTFARKHVRDHQPQYLQHIPRTLRYLQQVTSAYPELAPLHVYVQSVDSSPQLQLCFAHQQQSQA